LHALLVDIQKSAAIGMFLARHVSSADVQRCALMVRPSLSDSASPSDCPINRHHTSRRWWSVRGSCLSMVWLGINGNRFVEVATGHLQSELSLLEGRMRSLEDGIAILHALESDKPHPLLTSSESKDEDATGRLQEETSPDAPVSPVAGPGILYLDARGSAMFFGPSGGSEASSLTQALGNSLIHPVELIDCQSDFQLSSICTQSLTLC